MISAFYFGGSNSTWAYPEIISSYPPPPPIRFATSLDWGTPEPARTENINVLSQIDVICVSVSVPRPLPFVMPVFPQGSPFDCLT